MMNLQATLENLQAWAARQQAAAVDGHPPSEHAQGQIDAYQEVISHIADILHPPAIVDYPRVSPDFLRFWGGGGD